MTAPVEVRNRVLNARLNQAVGIELNNASILNTAGTPAGSIDQQSKSWSLNLKCKDTTFDPVNPYAVLATDCTGLAGVTVVASASCAGLSARLYQARTLMLVAYDSSNNILNYANYGEVPDTSAHLLTLEWAVPANTSRLEYRLYTTTDGTGVWWSQPILCTKTDWQALQSVGVTYFNQDTLPE